VILNYLKWLHSFGILPKSKTKAYQTSLATHDIQKWISGNTVKSTSLNFYFSAYNFKKIRILTGWYRQTSFFVRLMRDGRIGSLFSPQAKADILLCEPTQITINYSFPKTLRSFNLVSKYFTWLWLLFYVIVSLSWLLSSNPEFENSSLVALIMLAFSPIIAFIMHGLFGVFIEKVSRPTFYRLQDLLERELALTQIKS
tara:strand:+ start:460 stop:1056 length:597 start_codon:yes stop_codon:yes gene_type:complete